MFILFLLVNWGRARWRVKGRQEPPTDASDWFTQLDVFAYGLQMFYLPVVVEDNFFLAKPPADFFQLETLHVDTLKGLVRRIEDVAILKPVDEETVFGYPVPLAFDRTLRDNLDAFKRRTVFGNGKDRRLKLLPFPSGQFFPASDVSSDEDLIVFLHFVPPIGESHRGQSGHDPEGVLHAYPIY